MYHMFYGILTILNPVTVIIFGTKVKDIDFYEKAYAFPKKEKLQIACFVSMILTMTIPFLILPLILALLSSAEDSSVHPDTALILVTGAILLSVALPFIAAAIAESIIFIGWTKGYKKYMPWLMAGIDYVMMFLSMLLTLLVLSLFLGEKAVTLDIAAAARRAPINISDYTLVFLSIAMMQTVSFLLLALKELINGLLFRCRIGRIIKELIMAGVNLILAALIYLIGAMLEPELPEALVSFILLAGVNVACTIILYRLIRHGRLGAARETTQKAL